MSNLLFLVKLGITGLTTSQLIDRTKAIILALTGNAAFATPIPSILILQAALDALVDAEAAVLNNGGKQDRLTRDEREQDLRNLLTALGGYVQAASGGNAEAILSAGFAVRKAPSPVGQMTAPQNLRIIVNVLPGVLEVRWDGVRRHLFYDLEFCEGDPLVPANWKALASQGRNAYRVEDLTSGTPYSFRVRAVGAAGAGPWSDIAADKPR